MSHRPIALITGASSGIGADLARIFARHGHEVVLVARRKERLETLAKEIAAAGGRKPLVIAADLTKPQAVRTIMQALARRRVEPQYVVNNAGFGLIGRAEKLDRDEQLAMIDLNVRTLTALSVAFADSLARHKGGILNVGSMAGFLPGPGMAVYYATKAYVLSFSAALHHEFKSRGVRVTTLCPGPVPTEFRARAGATGELGPDIITVGSEKVAQDGFDGLMAGRRIVVPGLLNRLITLILPLVPWSILLSVISNRQSRRHRLR